MSKIINVISPINLSDSYTIIPEEKTSFKAQRIQKTASSSIMNKINCIIEKVKQIAQFILSASFSALLYWVNPSLFAIGFIAGIIIDDQVRCAIQKIKDVWNSQKMTGTLIGGFACALSMPVTLATASILWSAHLGSLMRASSQSFLDGKIQTLPAV